MKKSLKMNISDKNILQCIGSHIDCSKTWFNFCQLNKACRDIGIRMKDAKATLFTIREEPKEVGIDIVDYYYPRDSFARRFLPSGLLHGIQESWGSDGILSISYWKYGVFKWEKEYCYLCKPEYQCAEDCMEDCICGNLTGEYN